MNMKALKYIRNERTQWKKAAGSKTTHNVLKGSRDTNHLIKSPKDRVSHRHLIMCR